MLLCSSYPHSGPWCRLACARPETGRFGSFRIYTDSVCRPLRCVSDIDCRIQSYIALGVEYRDVSSGAEGLIKRGGKDCACAFSLVQQLSGCFPTVYSGTGQNFPGRCDWLAPGIAGYLIGSNSTNALFTKLTRTWQLIANVHSTTCWAMSVRARSFWSLT